MPTYTGIHSHRPPSKRLSEVGTAAAQPPLAACGTSRQSARQPSTETALDVKTSHFLSM